jgi:hypothetical protein
LQSLAADAYWLRFKPRHIGHDEIGHYERVIYLLQPALSHTPPFSLQWYPIFRVWTWAATDSNYPTILASQNISHIFDSRALRGFGSHAFAAHISLVWRMPPKVV